MTLMYIGWFSCGVTSAVAIKLAQACYSDVKPYFIQTGSEDKDSFRFLRECEEWFKCNIVILRSSKYTSHFDVIEKTGVVNTPFGAPCTKCLKKDVRYKLEDDLVSWDGQIFGFDVSERRRFLRFSEQYPKTKAIAPLIEQSLSKSDCMAILEREGIEIPMMYREGFSNNNCIGCVKGGKSYWSLIRRKYPDVFRRMMELENKYGHSCINGCFLKDLPVDYPYSKPIVPSCSIFCEVDFLDI